jgi:putative transposase
MTEDSSIVRFRQPDEIDDPLTALLRSGARRLLEQAIEAEVEAFLASRKDLKLTDGRDRLVRHGHGPERVIQTGIGPVEVQRIKVRDRGAGPASERIRFSSALLPRWARRTTSLDALLPILYLRGISAGDFQEALSVLLGKDAPNLSPSVIKRLKESWADDYARWQKRDLSARRYVYVWADGVWADGVWADGIYLQARMEPVADCMLVMIGATPEGRKELLGFQVGIRESAQSWHELLIDLKARGLQVAPELAVADGALGFWKALDEVFPGTRHQRCWFHKSGNVLNKVAKSIQPAVKQDLREIWMASRRRRTPSTSSRRSTAPSMPVPSSA